MLNAADGLGADLIVGTSQERVDPPYGGPIGDFLGADQDEARYVIVTIHAPQVVAVA